MNKDGHLAHSEPPICLHVLGQDLVNVLHHEGRKVVQERDRLQAAVRQAQDWLRAGAPGRALEALDKLGL